MSSEQEIASYIAELEATVDACGQVTPQQYQKEIDRLRKEIAALRSSQGGNEETLTYEDGIAEGMRLAVERDRRSPVGKEGELVIFPEPDWPEKDRVIADWFNSLRAKPDDADWDRLMAILALHFPAEKDETCICGVPGCTRYPPNQAEREPCPYDQDGCILEGNEIGPCLCANPDLRSPPKIIEDVDREYYQGIIAELREALELARTRVDYLGVAHPDQRHFVANQDIYLPRIDAALVPREESGAS